MDIGRMGVRFLEEERECLVIRRLGFVQRVGGRPVGNGRTIY